MKLIKNRNYQSFLTPAIYVFITTRIPLLILALFFIGFSQTSGNISFYDAFSQWDGQWYLKVAKEGYHWIGPTVQANVAFFPLYPLSAKIISLITGNLELSFIIVSHVSFFIFLVFSYKISKLFSSEKLAFRSIWYLAIFPLSFVFSVIYGESLFFMLCSGSLYYAYKNKWTAAAIFGFLATLTRFSGLVLLPTLLYYYFKTKKIHKFTEIIKLFIIPLGVIFFSFYLWIKVGDFWAYFHVLKAWRIVYQNPALTILSTFSMIQTLPKIHYFTALGVLDLSIFVFFIILLILSYKRLPRELFLFSTLIFLTYVFKSWDPRFFYSLGSTNRYLFEAFPLFFTLAKLGKNKLFDLTYTTLSLIFLGILSLSFFAGKWVL
ncbi:glycosyltransferase family 39 protein [Candidatus Gottesmanbacteria bacterium]|nr:glycosyltransferase family 39 protein [Candidatus Gottesmanbacteria bacterium]